MKSTKLKIILFFILIVQGQTLHSEFIVYGQGSFSSIDEKKHELTDTIRFGTNNGFNDIEFLSPEVLFHSRRGGSIGKRNPIKDEFLGRFEGESVLTSLDIIDMEISSKGELLVASENGEIFIFNAFSSVLISRFNTHRNISDIELSLSGELLIGGDDKIYRYDYKNGGFLGEFRVSGPVKDIAVYTVNEVVVSVATNFGTLPDDIKRYKLYTGELVNGFNIGFRSTDIEFDREGNLLVVGGPLLITIFDVSTGDLIANITRGLSGTPQHIEYFDETCDVCGSIGSLPFQTKIESSCTKGQVISTITETGNVVCEDLIPGVQGEAGPIGPAGSQGLQGKVGATGPAGPQGLQGKVGATGPAGPQGLQGEVGVTGPAGPQGLQGKVGATGPAGPQGLQGKVGATGSAGPQGLQGIEGKIGHKGPKGDPGPNKVEYIVTTFSVLSGIHNMCVAHENLGRIECNSAIHRFCMGKGFVGGINQEVSPPNVGVLCIGEL